MSLNNFQPLKFWLQENERSKSWLARKINVSPSLMNLMIAGKRTMSEYHKNNICYITDIPADELFPQ